MDKRKHDEFVGVLAMVMVGSGAASVVSGFLSGLCMILPDALSILILPFAAFAMIGFGIMFGSFLGIVATEAVYRLSLWLERKEQGGRKKKRRDG